MLQPGTGWAQNIFDTSPFGESCDQAALSNIASAPPGIFGPTTHFEHDLFPVFSVTDITSPTSSAQPLPVPSFTLASTTTTASPSPALADTPEDAGFYAPPSAEQQQVDGGACGNGYSASPDPPYKAAASNEIKAVDGALPRLDQDQSVTSLQGGHSPTGKLPLARPLQHRCPTCGKNFTAKRLRAHFKQQPAGHGQSMTCKIRYPCPANQCGKHYADKPGLARHVRSCQHLAGATAASPSPSGSGSGSGSGYYHCICGKPFARWDKFLAHHRVRGCDTTTTTSSNSSSSSSLGSDYEGDADHVTTTVTTDGRRHYICQCAASFASMESFVEHRRSEYKKVGRPRTRKRESSSPPPLPLP